tara:strand:- start:5761 stop:6063 length:303 start_codon:yes stop_codon:yes gene_type:complete
MLSYDFDPQKIIKSLDKDNLCQMEKLADVLIANPSANPAYVQELIYASNHPGLLGQASYTLLCLYATGRIEWSAGDPWSGIPGGWITKETARDSKDTSVN